MPSVSQLYRQREEKASRDPTSLSSEELSFFVNGLPRFYRHKHVPPKLIEESFDGGMLTLHELARTNMYDLNVAVKHIGKNGQLRKALRLTDYLVRTKKANQHTVAAFFQACLAVHRPTVVTRVWEFWVPAGMIGQISASAAIHCVASYDPELALDMLERMERCDIEIHQSSYHSMLKALAQCESLYSGLQLFDKMKQDQRVEPTIVTIQHVLNLIKACQGWEHTEDVYMYLIQRRLIPDSQLSASFMNLFCEGMQVHVAEAILRSKMRQWGSTAGVYHYNALLVAHARQGDLESVKALQREMERSGIAPDEYSIVAAMTASARCARTSVHDIEGVLALARRHGLEHNTYVCGALVQAYRNCGDVPPWRRQELAEAVVERMISEGVPLNSIVMNSLIALLWEAYEYGKARRQYDRMIDRGIMPNARTCQIMLWMCEEAGWEEEAEGFRVLRQTMPTIEGTTVHAWNPAGVEVVSEPDDDGVSSGDR